MILHRLMLEDFRGVTREEVEVPRRGVLIIEGPNESGKTSLMDALEMLLEHKASSGRADIKAASPVGRDVPVVVEAEFTIDDQRMRYRKEFVRGKRTSLEFLDSARPALSGDDAHDHVRELLERKVDRSLWRALRIAQDEPIGQVDAAKGMDSLRRALDSAAGGEDPTGDDSLISRVTEERNLYLTARRGEPTGELARSEARVAEARSALAVAEAGHAELDRAVEDHAAQAAVHRAHSGSLATMEAEVARLEAAGLIVADLRQVSSAADAEVDKVAAEHDAATRGARERAALVGEVERERARVTELLNAAAEARERLTPAEGRAAQAREALEEAETELVRARARLDRVRLASENTHRRRELERLDTVVETVRSVGEDLAAAEAELADIALPVDAVERIRAADEALRAAVVRSAASAPTVEVSGSGELRVDGESRGVDPGWSQQIVEDTVFEVGTVSLTVVPAGDTEAVRREEASARDRLESLFRECGVESREQVEERARRADSLGAEARALRRRRADLLGGDALEDLQERRRALRTLVESYEGDDGADAESLVGSTPAESGLVTESGGDGEQALGTSSVDDPAAAAVEAEKSLALRRTGDRIAAAEAEAARTDHATRSALAAEAEARLQERVQALETARDGVTDQELSEAEERTSSRLAEAREAARRARAALDDALGDSPPELLENARASLTALRAEERESAAAVATALGLVNAIGDQGRLGDVASAEQELDEAERENRALWRRARAADLLLRTLLARRSEALRSYQQPYHRAIVELGRLVYGREFDVQLGEDLTILSRRVGDTTVEYDSLSGGAREQLAVIARIACARIVGAEGVPVFLDDTMGYTDPVRRMTMGAVIAAAASTSQVIVLTCDRARFAGVGGARTHVMRRSAAPVG